MKTTLPETGFIRVCHIVGDKKRGIPALIPVSPATWWNGVRSGRYPQSFKISKGCTAWRVEDIRNLMKELCITANDPYSEKAA
jgi:predicted DNA-binding transcriptional regulator AlpA